MLVSHIIFSERLKLDDEHLANIQRYPEPTTKRQLRDFWGDEQGTVTFGFLIFL